MDNKFDEMKSRYIKVLHDLGFLERVIFALMVQCERRFRLSNGKIIFGSPKEETETDFGDDEALAVKMLKERDWILEKSSDEYRFTSKGEEIVRYVHFFDLI